MGSTTVISEWREVYPVCFEDGPDNEMKPVRARPSRWTTVFLVNHVLALRLPNGRGDEVRRTVGVQECSGATAEQLRKDMTSFFRQDDVRLLADDVKANDDGDVPKKEPASPHLLDGTDLIFQSKAHLICDEPSI